MSKNENSFLLTIIGWKMEHKSNGRTKLICCELMLIVGQKRVEEGSTGETLMPSSMDIPNHGLQFFIDRLYAGKSKFDQQQISLLVGDCQETIFVSENVAVNPHSQLLIDCRDAGFVD